MEEQAAQGGYRLEVPLDASGVEGFEPDQKVKVLALDRSGTPQSTVVGLNERGQGMASLQYPEAPGMLRVILGPESADDDELQGLQTITLTVAPSQWQDQRTLRIPPVVIPPFYWWWWHRWCRTFRIHGRVLCPDGSPVPGAQVCAYDVDWWWWWTSRQQVGCATTDATGSFTITFRWCCGWWPWWWWRFRLWQLEPLLAERIQHLLYRTPSIVKLPSPSPQPSLAMFESLLGEDPSFARKQVRALNPEALPALRESLLQKLPASAELEGLHVWPWWPWAPWWDCTPDIVFRVTQDCLSQGTVIVDEGLGAVRWDIPTSLNVTLVANEKACCIRPCRDPKECPEGICVVPTQVCTIPVSSIGGNLGAPAPLGFVNPGLVSSGGDRPFAGVVPISAVFGDMTHVDYYELEWATAPAGPWHPMPPPAAGGFTRLYWGPRLGGGPVGTWPQTFSFVTKSGRNVVESRQHFEATNAPGTWDLTHFWIYNRDLLMNWLTENTFPDGTYYLRLLAWDIAGDNLTNGRILPLCDTQTDNSLVLTLDNRPAPGPGSGHPPSVPSHPCGPGTVHLCTLEPDTDFLSVNLRDSGGALTPVGACSNEQADRNGSLEIDFFAYDPDGHLAYYTLVATHGESAVDDLLALGTLTPGAPSGAIPSAVQVGPSYAEARSANPPPAGGAAAPIWTGGTLHLSVPFGAAHFENCCYQLELRAYKRTIVSCDGSFEGHANVSEFTFGLTF